MSPRPTSVDSPSRADGTSPLREDTAANNLNSSIESPLGIANESSRISGGLTNALKDAAKGSTKANQIVLMTQEELKKILDERLQQHP